MMITSHVFDGTVTEPETILTVLRDSIFPEAKRRMNEELLPFQFALYDTDHVPTNQRNLTDVRTRMGTLLEYELGKAVNSVLGEAVTAEVILTYVISNKYPDLAFRTRAGRIGVRFEVKALEAIAEEKSANFDTLIKDIRKGTDFVVVILWEWTRHQTHAIRYPHVYDIFVLDAYHIAQMRDCYWLNTPPSSITGEARQGFDLCFGVNCNGDSYNQEEGNYGKIMRVCDPAYVHYLPDHVRHGSTLNEYFAMRRRILTLGLNRIARDIGGEFAGPGGELQVESDDLAVIIVAARNGQRLMIIGDEGMPRAPEAKRLTDKHGCQYALLINSKFRWKALDARQKLIEEGSKPHHAIAFVQSL